MSGLQRCRPQCPAELLWTHLLLPLSSRTSVGDTLEFQHCPRFRLKIHPQTPCLSSCFRDSSSSSIPVCPVDGQLISRAEVCSYIFIRGLSCGSADQKIKHFFKCRFSKTTAANAKLPVWRFSAPTLQHAPLSLRYTDYRYYCKRPPSPLIHTI